MPSPLDRLKRAFSPADTVRPKKVPNMPRPGGFAKKKSKKPLPNVGGLGGMTTKMPKMGGRMK